MLPHTRYLLNTSVHISTHISSGSNVTHECMLNHTWGSWSPPLTLVGGCYKQSWAPFLAFLPSFPLGESTMLSSSISLALSSILCTHLYSFHFLIPHHLTSHCLSSSLYSPPSPSLPWLSCCILDPSVGRRSNNGKAKQQYKESGRNTLQGLKWIQV